MISSREIVEVLTGMSDPRQACRMRRFFKTGPGEYGEGDIIVGLRNPQVRMVVKETWKETPLAEAVQLVRSPLHEVRLCGLLILVEQYLAAMKKKEAAAMTNIFNTYLELHTYINNWDLVDLSAIKIVGNHEVASGNRSIMDDWIIPDGHSMWQQRIAMVSCWMLIRAGRPDVSFRRASMLMSSPHDLLHKAAGWMLREAWKKGYREELRNYLSEHVTRMPAVMLNYACEQMSLAERHVWQRKRKSGTP